MSSDIYSIGQYLSQLLETDSFSFDDAIINGLQVEGNRPIHRIATVVTPSLFAIEEAWRQNADLLLAHHGLFLKREFCGIRRSLRKRVGQLIQSGMHLLAYHLPVDAHREFGNAWPIAKELGWTALQPFGLVGSRAIGVRGHLAEPLPGQEFFALMQQFWGREGVYVSNIASREVRTCAFVSGGGHKFLKEAIDSKVDCFITGSVDEYCWHLAREEGVHFMSFGHYATEKTGVQLLGKHLSERLDCEYFFIEEDNPF